jgi:molecular chaperone GrpE
VNDYQENRDILESDIEFFDTDELPSLEDLMLELEKEEKSESEYETVVSPPQSANIIDLSTTMPANSALEAELQQAYQRLFENEQEKQELADSVERVNGNFKKYRWRAERERTEHYAFAVVSIVREFLPILDNLTRALQTANNLPEVKKSSEESNLESQNFFNFVGGIELIYQQTMKFLSDMGVEEIKSVGELFDPNVHDAVAAEENSDLPPNTITEEVLRGYKLGDKMIRAAMVKVTIKQQSGVLNAE